MKTAAVRVEQDAEIELLDRLETALTRTGFLADRIDIVNFYVALKHRSLAILAGPAGNGKVALLECMADLLTAGNSLQRQIAPGHAWYAGRNPANTALIGMHARMITEKLLFAIEEASQPENAHRLFIVGLTHISPAEQLSFFTEVGCQLQHKQIMRVGDVHLSESVPFPPNLLLIGTLDTVGFNWQDDDLLSGGTVIEWSARRDAPQTAVAGELPDFGYQFMRSSLRNSRRAYKKLLSVVAGVRQPLQIIMLLRGVFRTHGFELPADLLNDVILYLANAWSRQGIGLFDPATAHNLDIAFDLAVAQLVLPQSRRTILSSQKLQTHLCPILKEHLPRSSAFFKRQCEGYNS